MNFLDKKYLIGLALTLFLIFLLTSNIKICMYGGHISYDMEQLNELCGVSSYEDLREQLRADSSFCPEKEEARTNNNICNRSFPLRALALLISALIYTLIYRKFA